MSSSDLKFKGYAIHSTEGENWHKFKVIDFECASTLFRSGLRRDWS